MMGDSGIEALLLKVGAGTVFGSVAMMEALSGHSSLPFFNVSISTLGMAAAGSMLAFAYGTPVDSRRKLYGYAIGGMFIGVWVVQIVPVWLGWGWYTAAVMEPPLAGVTALLSRWIVPFVVDNIPAVWKRVFNTGSRAGDV